MKEDTMLHRLQLTQLLVLKGDQGSIRVATVPGPMHQMMANIALTPGQRAGLAALCGLA